MKTTPKFHENEVFRSYLVIFHHGSRFRIREHKMLSLKNFPQSIEGRHFDAACMNRVVLREDLYKNLKSIGDTKIPSIFLIIFLIKDRSHFFIGRR